jgi:hypothetical protein
VPVQRGLVEDDHVIEAFSPDRADDAFHKGTFPGATGESKGPLPTANPICDICDLLPYARKVCAIHRGLEDSRKIAMPSAVTYNPPHAHAEPPFRD